LLAALCLLLIAVCFHYSFSDYYCSCLGLDSDAKKSKPVAMSSGRKDVSLKRKFEEMRTNFEDMIWS